MREKIPLLLAVVLIVLLPAVAFPAPKKPSVPPPVVPPVPFITLGNSAAPLTGPWKFSPGDTPWEGDAPQWAQPAFDDSRWANLDLTPQGDPFNLAIDAKNTVPGWTATGYPNLTGFAWYRLRVRVADPSQILWLKMPADFDDAYQVYVNGQFAGQFGQFDSSPPKLFYSRPASFALPPTVNGEIVLALRFYMAPLNPFSAPSPGGMRAPPILGQRFVVQLIESAQNTAIAYARFGVLLNTLLFLLLAPASLWLWLENRKELTFFWLFLNLAGTAFFKILGGVAIATYWIPKNTVAFWIYIVLNPAWLPGWIMVWTYWFGLNRKRWILLTTWLMAAANIFVEYCALSPTRSYDFLPMLSRELCNDASLALVAATCVLLLVVLFEGYRRDPAEALLAVIPIFLLELASVSYYLTPLLNIPSPILNVFGLSIDFGSLASIVMALVVGTLVLRRFLRNRVARELSRQILDQDLEQARELQQRVLVPENISSHSFTVETEYRPAQIVGGDFYQTVLGIDGSLLVIVGDVSGKGISAAMLVAVLVGAARTRAGDSFDPASMLVSLNQHLSGRSGGHFATCLVAQFRPNGLLRIANAGHIPPYLNGCELDLEGSLPLGIAGTLDPSKKAFQLRPGDQLTFITDGIVEARNKNGELFGFDRARVLSTASAEKVAQEAQAFGQEDDITVLRVAYTGERREVPRSVPALSKQI
jgi:serine/threonine protein phosphatase PrpC